MPHAQWAKLGFGPWQIPIIPPNVALTADTKVPPSQRGKVPGLRTVRGEWHGFIKWHGAEATPADHAVWDEMGAGVGLQCGRFIAVDIDVLDENAAGVLAAIAGSMLGAGQVRFGRAPKRVLLFAAAAGETITKRRIAFRLPGMAAKAAPHAVEILGEGQFFVVEGIHPGTMKPYTWPDGDPLAFECVPVTAAQIDAYVAAVADAVVELGGEVVKRTTAAVGTGRHDVDQDSLRAPSAELLIEAAPHVPNTGGYDEWIAGLAAWKGAAAGLLDDDGEALARDWTERWTGEGAGGGGHIDFEDKWARIEPPYAAGWQQIERMARTGGWYRGVEADFQAHGVDFAAIARQAEESAAEAAEAEPVTLQEAMFARYVWVEAVERIGDTVEKVLLTRVQFNARLAEIGPPHDSRRCAWAVFLADKERCRHVVAATYRPAAPALVEEPGKGLCLNEWRDDGVQPAPGPVADVSVRPFLDLAHRLYPDPTVRGLVLDWLAWVAQNPGRKPQFGLVLGGHQGIGKDSLLLPLAALAGPSNTCHVTMQDVLSGQTWYLAKTRLLIVQEVHSFTRIEVADRFKPLLANLPPEVVVNIKFVPQYKVPNLAACVMMTNRQDALAIDRDDRRHMVAWSPHPDINGLDEAERAEADAFFAALHAWYEREGHGLVARWLLQRDVAAFGRLTRAPWTEGKEGMRQAARSDVAEAIEEAAADWPDLVAPADLAVRLSAGRAGKAVTGKAVAAVLRGMGADLVTRGPVLVPATATAGGATKLRLWALRDAARYRAMPDAALGRQFGEMWGATKQDIEATFTGAVRGA